MNFQTGEEDGSGWAGLAGDKESPEFLDGVNSVVTIRCMEHRESRQINIGEGAGGECGECIRQQCWKDMLGLIAKTIENTPHGMDGKDALAALEESLLIEGIGTFGVPNELEAKFRARQD